MRKPSLRKTAAILFIVVLLAGLAACGGDEDPDGRIVKINDEAITNGQFENFCTLWLYTQGFDPSEPLTSDQKSLALGDMINAEALRQYYEKEDPSVFSNSYQSSLDTFLNQMKTGNAEFLSSHDISDEDIGRKPVSTRSVRSRKKTFSQRKRKNIMTNMKRNSEVRLLTSLWKKFTICFTAKCTIRS